MSQFLHTELKLQCTVCIIRVCVYVCVLDLFLVCVLLGGVLQLLLYACDPCAPSDPADPWSRAGVVRAPLWDWTAAAIVLIFTVLQGALYYLPVGQVRKPFFSLLFNLYFGSSPERLVFSCSSVTSQLEPPSEALPTQ